MLVRAYLEDYSRYHVKTVAKLKQVSIRVTRMVRGLENKTEERLREPGMFSLEKKSLSEAFSLSVFQIQIVFFKYRRSCHM